MSEQILTPVLLAAAGLVAGTINSIAGGGSLLTLPLLIFVGLPPTVANATNRIAIFVGGVGATTSFHRRGLIPFAWVRFALPPALIGVAVGTWGATRIGDVAFERLLAFVLILAAGWMVWHPVNPPSGGSPEAPDPARRWLLRLAFLGIGLYSGFIQAGVGFLFLALLSSQGLDLVRGNAVKVPLVLSFMALSVAMFAVSGMLDWGAGLALAGGQFFGAKLGVHLQVLKGQAWVRNVLTVTIVVFAVRLMVGG
ncbi:MAG: hypothetical protein AMS19_08615 [Gemmatimonas sp. SG8_23]|nr:MAG: hypothetical protein AMS19_08615 [Gemmatimonas sp. SG8_23]